MALFVDRLSTRLAPRMSRRGFFARSALAGTALAVVPTDFVLKPTSAYAAICDYYGSSCDCGALCGDGYTEFCCTLNGKNQCPPGTSLGGWWKADGTGLCPGSRYYMDCNANCNGCGCGGGGICSGACSGTGCGCANGDCNNRKAGCTQFRYGQCNQGVACLGPILCRVVTCIAPWQIDGSCSTTVMYDQNTAGHDRPCLHTAVGTLDVAEDAAGAIRVAGWALDFDTSDSLQVHVYIDGSFQGAFNANLARPDIAAAYPGQGPNHGYDVRVNTSGGTHRVDVYAINAGPGVNPLLGTRTVTVGNPFGSYDLLAGGLGSIRIGGWAIDPDTSNPIQVHVYVDGVFQGPYTANVPRPDIGGAYPGAGPNHGFDITIPATDGDHAVSVWAINTGPGSINQFLGTRVTHVNSSPVGSLDIVAAAPGGIRFGGWAFDPDTTNPIDLHIYVDNVRVATPTANLGRPDIGAAYPAFGPNHGFDLTVPTGAGSHYVEVYAINVGSGVNPRLGTRTVQVGGSPIGSVDLIAASIDLVRVAGWAIDLDSVGPITIDVAIDGVSAGTFPANAPRNDVAAAHPGYGANHGFDVSVTSTPGSHTVTVTAINTGGGSNSLLGSKGIAISPMPLGSLDAVTPGAGNARLAGWAFDPDTTGPIDVHVWLDGVFAGPFVANVTRPDIGAAFPAMGPDHGFDITIPLSSGPHHVDVYAINVGAGFNPLLASRDFQVA